MRLVALAAVLAAALPCLAEEADSYLLRYKLKQGEVLRWEVDQRTSVRNRMEGASEKAQTKTVSLKAWRVIDVMPDGEMEFLSIVEQVRMENRLPKRAPMIYDSTAGEEPPPGFEDAARAIGVPLSSIRISPRGEVVDREVKHHQPAADPHQQVVMLLPEKEIAIGDSWTQPSTIRVKLKEGGTKEINARRKYTLQSVSAGVATIAAEFQVLSTITPAIEGQLAHRMVKGVVRFDIEKGRLLSQKLDVDRRVLGFAGPSSSMHLITRMEEKLQRESAEVASRK